MMVALSGWMLYTMYAVLGLIGLNVLAGMYRALMSNTFSLSLVPNFLGDMLHTVLPLMILAGAQTYDPTGWIALIAYYVAGVGLIWRYLMEIKGKFW
ncbi:hypothetical protein OS242_07920 [Tumebacillus sp. DT12]|uniref:Uncharacterized protein n=1 Tax=Tumebacillus lacus TaxID=2995335 RepID=A0ABT3WYY9_9BACL|nr:hypothetical protein [Tumebacillus lacus]MCX7569889.1 hypothetical protein [Tumebacillus lacus]